MKTLIVLIAFLLTGSLHAATRQGLDISGKPDPASIQTYATSATKLGVKAVRFFFSIYTWTPSGNNAPYYYGDNITQLKNRINTFANAGFRVTVVLSGHECASTLSCPPQPLTLVGKRSDGSFQTQMDTYETQWMNDVGDAVLQKVSAIEIWNEGGGAGGYGYKLNGKNYPYSAPDYVEKLLHSSLTIKAKYPKMEIVIMSVVTNDEGTIPSRNYLGQLVAAGAQKFGDVFDYHPYVNTSADLDRRITAAQTTIASTAKPLMISEWGCLNCSTAVTASVITGGIPVIQQHNLEEADYYLLQENPTNSSCLLNASNQPNTLYAAFAVALTKPIATPTPKPTPSPTPIPTKTVTLQCDSWNWATSTCPIPGITKALSITKMTPNPWCDTSFVHNGVPTSYKLVGNSIVVTSGCRAKFDVLAQ